MNYITGKGVFSAAATAAATANANANAATAAAAAAATAAAAANAPLPPTPLPPTSPQPQPQMPHWLPPTPPPPTPVELLPPPTPLPRRPPLSVRRSSVRASLPQQLFHVIPVMPEGKGSLFRQASLARAERLIRGQFRIRRLPIIRRIVCFTGTTCAFADDGKQKLLTGS